MQVVRVNLGPRSYDIGLTTAQVGGIGAFVHERLPKSALALVVCDRNTQSHGLAVEQSLQAAGLRTALTAIPPGEGSKTLAEASRLYDALYEMAADRHTVVVAAGGGVVGDLAGFVA